MEELDVWPQPPVLPPPSNEKEYKKSDDYIRTEKNAGLANRAINRINPSQAAKNASVVKSKMYPLNCIIF